MKLPHFKKVTEPSQTKTARNERLSRETTDSSGLNETTKTKESELSLNKQQHTPTNNATDLVNAPSTECSFETDEDFLNFLNDNVLNETLRVKLRYLAAKNEDPKQDTKCQTLLTDIDKAQSTIDLYKHVMPSPKISTSSQKVN